MHTPLHANNTVPGVHRGERDFSSYLLACVFLDRKIEGALLKKLRAANESVNETRSSLSLGRANVDVDIQKNGEEIKGRLRLIRHTHPSGRAFSTARSKFIKTGVCGEYANVVAYNYLKKFIAEGELVAYCSAGEKVDHGWVEIKISSGERIRMDGWGNGPAIFADHGKFVFDHEWGKGEFCYDNISGKTFVEKVDKHLNHLALKENKDALLERFEKQFRFFLAGITVWSEESVISDQLQQDIQTKLDKRDKLLREELISKSNVTKETLQARDSHQTTLNDEIRAVGVARSLGANIGGAVADIEKIICAYKTRFQQGYIGCRVSE